MKHDLEWLALQAALGQGAVIRPLIEAFGGAAQILSLSEADKIKSGLFTPRQLQKLNHVDLKTAGRSIEQCRENNWNIYTYEDAVYPSCLREIPNPPAALFCWGEMPEFDQRLSIGVVGSREASSYALRATDYLSFVMAKCGGVIVSGGAMGVDSASHRAALHAGGITVAVLGCGFGTNYLMQYEALRQQIVQSGALLTEYPPFTEITRSSFPLRNRIISALCDGIVVVEAALKSGSLITAKRALEQGRDVFAVPGSIVSHAYAGTNKLLEDGALAALSPEMILAHYAGRYASVDFSRLLSLAEWQAATASQPAAPILKKKPSAPQSMGNVGESATRKQDDRLPSLSATLQTIYNSLTDTYEHIDIIIGKTGLQGPVVSSGLTQLELVGLAEPAAGKRYRKDERKWLPN